MHWNYRLVRDDDVVHLAEVFYEEVLAVVAASSVIDVD